MNESNHIVPLKSGTAEKVSMPCRVVNALEGLLCNDPVTRRPLLAVNSCTPGGAGGAAIFIDYETGEDHVIPLAKGSGGRAICVIGPESLLFESLASLYLTPIDLRTRQIDTDKMATHHDNTYAWQFAAGPNGLIYFGSYPTCHLYRYHPGTGAIEDLGHVGPEGNLYVRSVGVTEDGWVLCSVMTKKTGIVALELETRQQHWIDMPDGTDTFASFVTINGTVYYPFDGCLQQFDSATISFIPNRLPPAPTGKPWSALSQSSTPQHILAVADDKTWLIKPGMEPELVWELNLRGGKIVGIDDKNRVIGLRGQDYFVAEAQAKNITPHPITTNAPPVAIHFLRADPAGGVIGGPSFGQTLFRFDPARNLAENTGQVLDGCGEVYDGIWIDGKFYFSSYSGGDLGVWDPAEPWDQWNGINPKALAHFKDHPNGSLIRPIGGLVLGPQNRLYTAGSAIYGVTGGALAEYDRTTGESRLWPESVFEPEMSIGSIAADEKYIYGFTSNSFNGLTPPPRPVVFWVFDPQTEQVVFRETLSGVLHAPAVVRVPETGHIWLALPTGVRRFNRHTLQMQEMLNWPEGMDTEVDFSRCDVRGNRAWFALGSRLVVLNDNEHPSLQDFFDCGDYFYSFAVGEDGKFYYSINSELWSCPIES